ncbi:MAG: transcriptional regulator [Phycisphaerae bacterium]|nr:transcriptional regulator [Phycisphaerae bacterium]
MPRTKRDHKTKLPGRFEDLVQLMPPQAIVDDVQCDNTTEMIDRLMASGTLTHGQESYMETLVQLVQAYEAAHHEIKARKGIATLKHLLDENGMNASDLARLLGVHASMGSKILKRERALTVDHLKLLSARFKVRAETFMD